MSRSVLTALIVSLFSLVCLAVTVLVRGSAPEPELILSHQGFLVLLSVFFAGAFGALAGMAGMMRHRDNIQSIWG